MDPCQQFGVAGMVRRAVRQNSGNARMDGVDAGDDACGFLGTAIGGQRDEPRGAAQPARHVRPEVGMIPHAGQHGGVQHLQQQAGDAAGHHGGDVAMDAPGDGGFPEQAVRPARDGFLAAGLVIENGDDFAGYGGFQTADEVVSRVGHSRVLGHAALSGTKGEGARKPRFLKKAPPRVRRKSNLSEPSVRRIAAPPRRRRIPAHQNASFPAPAKIPWVRPPRRKPSGPGPAG